jgi:hypothetical protein
VKPRISKPLNGNIYAILAVAKEVLVQVDRAADAEVMIDRAIKSGSYDAAKVVIREYVDFTVEGE